MFLCAGMNPPTLEKPPTVIDAHCAMTGRKIEEGYRVDFLVTDATSQPHEIFKYPSDWCSVETARLFKSMRGEASLLGNLFVSADGGSKPMVSRDSATKANRPCWHDLVMALEPEQWTVAVFTEESKRRFWLDAPLCLTGKAWRPYLHYGNCSRVLTVDLARLKETLVLAESIYTVGFSKDAMLYGLFDNFQQVQKTGYVNTLTLERHLLPYRGTDELLLSCFIVQKKVIAEEPQKETELCQTASSEMSPPQGQIALW